MNDQLNNDAELPHGAAALAVPDREIELMNNFWAAADWLTADHIRPRRPGGGVAITGISLIYVQLNCLIFATGLADPVRYRPWPWWSGCGVKPVSGRRLLGLLSEREPQQSRTGGAAAAVFSPCRHVARQT